MSDAVLVALIAGLTNIASQVIARWLSHNEHKKTSEEVSEIRDMVKNGKHK